MSNSLELPEVTQVADTLRGYEQWRLARAANTNWLSVSAYVDDLALQRQADILQEIVGLAQDFDMHNDDFARSVRILLGV